MPENAKNVVFLQSIGVMYVLAKAGRKPTDAPLFSITHRPDAGQNTRMTKTLNILVLLLTLCISMPASGQMANPVKVSSELKLLSDTEAEILFHATISHGWHVYGPQAMDNGPIRATFNTDKLAGAKLIGSLQARGKVVNKFEELFGMNVFYYENNVTFVQKVGFTGGPYNIVGYLQYGACSDQNCLPPSNVEVSYTGTAKAAATGNNDKKDAATQQQSTEQKADAASASEEATAADDDALPATADSVPATTAAADSATTSVDNALWTPVIDDLKALDKSGLAAATENPLWQIFLLGLLGGLVALVTPCVWPIIPMTVSFFLKRSGDKKKGIRDAITYGISIVIIYVALGLIITGIFGASALNSLATNAVFNIFFFLMLVVFAASFLGAFELTLPTKWSNAVDSKAEKTSGLLSIFLMAFTLTLVSFSCTGPIIGFLLVGVSQNADILAPAVGMLGFAIALALPFTLFALFPSWLKAAPKSGGWMNTVKVVLGFIELAFALKFLSVADLAYGWHILDRETFLALWIAIFFLLGAYLLNFIKFPHDDAADRTTGVARFFMGLVSFAFAIYMIPGLWGAPLKAISAFAPPMKTQDFNLMAEEEGEHVFTDYDEGMAYAKAHGKPVLIDFTGYGCVNCRKMEASVWTDKRVAQIMSEDYVLIQLYVDERTPLPQVIVVEDHGQLRKLRTVGDKWSYFQSHKFGANAQPFYVLLDHAGKPMTAAYTFDENVEHFLQFLETGKQVFASR